MLLLVSCAILFLSFTQEVESKCSKISPSENLLPSNIKQLDHQDYPAGFFINFHLSSIRWIQNWPNYTTSPELCNTVLLPIGRNYLKGSYRPRGCCAHCCLIDKIEKHLAFYYHYRNGTIKGIRLSSKRKPGKLAAMGFRNDSKILIHMHGYTEDGYLGRSPRLMAAAFAKRKEYYNVFSLDFSELTAMPWYHESIENLPLISKAAAEFLIFYHNTGELRIENIHLTGISFGGNLATYLAKELGKFKKVARYTGLDPAGPYFKFNDPELDISQNDAEFVDVIHTSPGTYGINKSLGHADFYVQYPPGVNRPGCEILKLMDMGDIAEYTMCDHTRSIRLFMQTVANPYLFPVCKKVSVDGNSSKQLCGYFGFKANKSTTIGEYFLTPGPDWDAFKEYEGVE